MTKELECANLYMKSRGQRPIIYVYNKEYKLSKALLPILQTAAPAAGRNIHMTLKDAKVGQTVRVVRLNGDGALKRRIMDMGITKGTRLYVKKLAPLGDPMELTVRGYELSLRKADAQMVEVEP